jgi:hypothetical protein
VVSPSLKGEETGSLNLKGKGRTNSKEKLKLVSNEKKRSIRTRVRRPDADEAGRRNRNRMGQCEGGGPRGGELRRMR